MVQVWTNGEDSKNLADIVSALDKQVKAKKAAEFHAFVITLVDKDGIDSTSKSLTEMAGKLKVEDIHITYLDKSDRGVRGYRVNVDPAVKNTVFVYRNKKVTDKFVNFKADEKGLAQLNAAIDKATQ
jgi:hypothetical protein